MTRRDPLPAMLGGLAFLERFALGDACWSAHAPDAMYLFFHLATRPEPGELTRRAHASATAAAMRWCGENPRLPAGTGPTDLLWWYAYGTYTPTRLGLDTGPMLRDLSRALARCTPFELLWFDPRREPPPRSLYVACACGREDGRGPRCSQCGARLGRLDPYDAWVAALVGTHLAEELGLDIGCRVRDAARWRSAMQPYPRFWRVVAARAHRAFYAVTHLVYVLDDYSARRLPRAPLLPEIAFVREACEHGLATDDVEILGESVDVLLAVDEPESDPLIVAARARLLELQNRDGSWGSDDDDVYVRLHKTWVALDGLTRCGPREVAPLPRGFATGRRPGRSAR